MENPTGWDLLTSCLAVCDLDDGDESWAFLLDQGLIRDDGRESFDAALAGRNDPDETSQAFSEAALSVGRLRFKGISTDVGTVADPWAQNAAKRFLDWTLSRCPPETSRGDDQEDGYFLLRRYETEGPFDLDELQAMSSRGELHDFRGVRIRGQWLPLLPHGIVRLECSTPWSRLLRRFGLGSGTEVDWIAPLDYALELGGVDSG